MSDDDGNLISGTYAITDLFKKHFEKLLNNTLVMKGNDVYEQIIFEPCNWRYLSQVLTKFK